VDDVTLDVDALLVGLPFAPERLVLDPRVAQRHLWRVVIEHPLDRGQRDVVVDHASAERVAELVHRDPCGLAGGVADVIVAGPAIKAP
jgi:hypothetical protein